MSIPLVNSNIKNLNTKKTNEFLYKNSINYKILHTLNEVSYKKIKKNSIYSVLLKTYHKFILYGNLTYDLKKRLIINLLFKDMIHHYKIWRQIKGYPVNGQRTWSNGKTATKNNNLLKNFRVKQIILAFGKKRKNKANQLVLGEYINKLWMKTWVSEWTQAKKYNIKSSRKKEEKKIQFL